MFSSKLTTYSAVLVRTQRLGSLVDGRAAYFSSGATKFLDAFEVLNMERKFDLSEDELKKSYRSLMANLHPDKHYEKSPSEQEALREKASEVTQSYQILKAFPTRATHMLQLFGKVEDMDESSMKDLLDGSQGNLLLMEVMEIREEIDETDSEEGLKSLLEENTKKIEDVCNQLAGAFSTEDLDLALELTVKLQYYNRIDETIRAKMD